ncbi:LacI family transcriptional regulator [Fontibacillus phaseoli]|uniref:LacI family transcriptional regulator n=1 Tax=Fontibacillus phaseoli TaxID=1416533 RepID=A0A369BPJ5_9BACL|nr:LacI family DNA-binding transcriptional regulator [Fontibacillus phaseoli]RCX22985.1 LacI family transcriptional regulator [Fontibacillus phaseoli]
MGRKKKVSMQDIADHLSISKNAVSLALLNKKGVSEEMRSRVLQTARELGYGEFAAKPPGSGGGNILVLVPERIMSYEDNDHFQFYHDMIWGLEKSIRKKGMNAVIAPIDREMESRLELPRHCSDIVYQGIILFGIVDKAYARVVWELDTPLVMLDSYYRDLPCPVVTSANIEGAWEAVSVLIGAGHRDIGFIGPTNLTTSHEERWFGYWKAMQEHKLNIADRFTLTSSQSFDHTEKEIGTFLKGLSVLPSAFFCGNDRIAYLLARQLRKRQGEDSTEISIVGFDGLKYEEVGGLKITTMSVEKEKMCNAAAKLLLSLSGPSREMVRVHVAPTLRHGNSVRER